MKVKSLSLMLIVASCVCLSSCGTLFTPSHQYIPISGTPDTKIYDKQNLIGQTDSEGLCNVKLKKSLSSKKLELKKEGYKNMYIKVDATFNAISVINLTNPIAWAIDLGTGKCCKFDEETIYFEMEKKKDTDGINR